MALLLLKNQIKIKSGLIKMGISPFFILLDALWYHIFNSILKYLYFKLKSR